MWNLSVNEGSFSLSRVEYFGTKFGIITVAVPPHYTSQKYQVVLNRFTSIAVSILVSTNSDRVAIAFDKSMSKENPIPPVPLTGRELLNTIGELREQARLPRQEIAKQCGYVSFTSSGEEKVNLTDLYDAVLSATKDITIRSELNLKAEKHFTRPWSTRRGSEHITRNANILLVRVSIEEFSAALADLAVESQIDVLGGEIRVSYPSSFAFQIVEHDWSILTPGYLKKSDIEQLSKQFQQPLIELNISDTCGYIGYSLYESGELVEQFDGYEGACIDPETLDPQTQKYELYPYPEDPEAQAQIAYFWSRRRTVTAEEIGNIRRFPDRLLVDFAAYDPAINSNYFLAGYHHFGAGPKPQTWRVQNPGFTWTTYNNDREVTTVPDFVRVDYFIFAPSQPIPK